MFWHQTFGFLGRLCFRNILEQSLAKTMESPNKNQRFGAKTLEGLHKNKKKVSVHGVAGQLKTPKLWFFGFLETLQCFGTKTFVFWDLSVFGKVVQQM